MPFSEENYRKSFDEIWTVSKESNSKANKAKVEEWLNVVACVGDASRITGVVDEKFECTLRVGEIAVVVRNTHVRSRATVEFEVDIGETTPPDLDIPGFPREFKFTVSSKGNGMEINQEDCHIGDPIPIIPDVAQLKGTLTGQRVIVPVVIRGIPPSDPMAKSFPYKWEIVLKLHL